ncbi:MAG: TlpA family protein disulfide reductase [Anaerolineae bacterium]|jgi:cytochrome c biogenesis protein CcmG/thiol:disulfide interchange protein DsbE
MTAETTAQTTTGDKRGSAGRYVVIAAALIFVALLAYGLFTGGDSRVESGKAPNFTVTDFDGKTWNLDGMEGQVVVVNFWATWCISCKDEAVDLEMAWRDYQDRGVQFLGIDYLDQEPLNFEYIERYGITYPNGPDIQGRIYNAYGVEGLPETFIIDHNGEVAKVFVGAVGQAQLSAALDQVLASASSS